MCTESGDRRQMRLANPKKKKTLRVAELRRELGRLGLPTNGLKAALVARRVERQQMRVLSVRLAPVRLRCRFAGSTLRLARARAAARRRRRQLLLLLMQQERRRSKAREI